MVNLVKLAEEALLENNIGEYFRIDVECGGYRADFKDFREVADVEVDANAVSDDLRLIVNSWARQGCFNIEKEWSIKSYGPSPDDNVSYIKSIKFVYVSESELKKQEQEEKERQEAKGKKDDLIKLGILKQ